MPSRRAFLASAGTLGAAALAGCSRGDGRDRAADAGDDTGWPTVGANRQHTRYVPDGTGPRSGVAEQWRVRTGEVTAEPVVAGDTVLATVGSDVRALDAASGDERWSLAPDNRSATFWTEPAVHDGTAYVAGDGVIRALTLEAGEVLWTREFEHSPTAPPTVADEGRGLFVGTGERLRRLDPDTGELEWQRRLFGHVRQAPTMGIATVVVATEAGELYWLDPGTGEGYWRHSLPDACRCTPTVVGRRTYVGCFDGSLYAFGQRGQAEWRTEIGGFAKGGIGVADGTVYADGGRELHALAADSGRKRWSIGVGTTGDHPPVIVGDTVYTGGDRLRALKPGGGVGTTDVRIEPARFSADLGDYVGPMAAANGSLYAAVTDEGDDDRQTALVRLDPAG